MTNAEEIRVTENGGKTITVITLNDCETYHGLKRCGGLVPEGEVAQRKLITLKTAFPGPGITDSAELIGRCVTRNRFMALPSEDICAPECIFGKLYFEIGYGNKVMKLTAVDGIVSPDFLAAGRKFYTGTANEKETETWIDFKGRLYDAVLSSNVENLFKIEY